MTNREWGDLLWPLMMPWSISLAELPVFYQEFNLADGEVGMGHGSPSINCDSAYRYPSGCLDGFKCRIWRRRWEGHSWKVYKKGV